MLGPNSVVWADSKIWTQARCHVSVPPIIRELYRFYVRNFAGKMLAYFIFENINSTSVRPSLWMLSSPLLRRFEAKAVDLFVMESSSNLARYVGNFSKIGKISTDPNFQGQ